MTKEKDYRENIEDIEEFDDDNFEDEEEDDEEDEEDEDDEEDDDEEENDKDENGLVLDLNCRENVIEFLKNQKTITVTLSQKKWKTKVKKIANKYPEQVEIISEDDGVMYAHLPIKALHLYITKSAKFTDGQREQKSSLLIGSNCEENVIEFLKNQKTITVTFSQKKWKTKVKKIARKYPEWVEIISEDDGVMYACLPINALHLYIKEKNITDEQREQMSKRMKEKLWNEK